MAAFTEKAIIDSFIKLLNQHPLDKIRVKDIIDECGINRSTFYYYFEDIYHLLEHILKTEAKRIAENHTEYHDWVDGVIAAMSFAIENKKAIYHIYKSVKREQLERYLHTVFDCVLQEMVSKNKIIEEYGYCVKTKDLELIRDLYKYGVSGLIFKWLEEGMTDEPEDKIRKLGILLDGNLKIMLENASKYNQEHPNE